MAPVPQDPLVVVVPAEKLDLPELEVRLAQQDPEDNEDSQDPLDQVDSQERLDPVERVDLLDPPVSLLCFSIRSLS